MLLTKRGRPPKKGQVTGGLSDDLDQIELPSAGDPFAAHGEDEAPLLTEDGVAHAPEVDDLDDDGDGSGLDTIDDVELSAEELDEVSRHTDDPIRMYLTQMAEIPLLTRVQELGLATEIDVTRTRFRRAVLECHFAQAEVVEILTKVSQGDARLTGLSSSRRRAASTRT